MDLVCEDHLQRVPRPYVTEAELMVVISETLEFLTRDRV